MVKHNSKDDLKKKYKLEYRSNANLIKEYKAKYKNNALYHKFRIRPRFVWIKRILNRYKSAAIIILNWKNRRFWKAIFRFGIFFLALFGILSISYSLVKKIADKKTNIISVIEIPSFDTETLLNDVESRFHFLSSRVKGVSFFVYKVKTKDNLWKLAKQYRYSVHTLIGVNPQLTTYNVNTNQKILVPSSGGTLHPIQKNDTWEKISQRYDIDDIKLLKDTNYAVKTLKEGEYLFIPGKRPVVDLMNQKMQEAYALRDLFISPIGGAITSAFGRRRHPVTGQISGHGGIDIRASEGTLVGAADDGVVIVASYDVGHYGVAVFIDHQNGYITHYGHLSSINVRVGQKVKAGQIIGRSGSTGRVTGPHLHFTIKKGDISIDPLRFLW
jgi:murein DD-endopeptidase MepM/ murein hydrolase activator NlpD